MSRVTAPATKLSRSISSTASIARPSHILVNGSKGAVSAGRIHGDADGIDSVDTARTLTTATASTISHRPIVPTHIRTVPLMQGFRTSAPAPARSDTSKIDFAVLPFLEGPVVDAYANVRVPLLPDNTRSGIARAIEQPDAPIARPEILVIAANPEHVSPSALTEVEGMGIDGVELRFAHDLGREPERETGMLRDIWKGLVEDILGPQTAGKTSPA